jgi:hypothetical protein
MSAWFVTEKHINVIVTAAIALDVIDEGLAQETGRELWGENAKSLIFRYGTDSKLADAVGDYQFKPEPTEDLIFIYKQVRCFNYQACEDPGYETSPSSALVEKLCARILEVTGLTHAPSLLHTDISLRQDYNSAPWGV